LVSVATTTAGAPLSQCSKHWYDCVRILSNYGCQHQPPESAGFLFPFILDQLSKWNCTYYFCCFLQFSAYLQSCQRSVSNTNTVLKAHTLCKRIGAFRSGNTKEVSRFRRSIFKLRTRVPLEDVNIHVYLRHMVQCAQHFCANMLHRL